MKNLMQDKGLKLVKQTSVEMLQSGVLILVRAGCIAERTSF
jgi:hypothetical protein